MAYTSGVKSRFFEKIRKLFTVNPETNTGVPIVGTYRTPAPGSQPKYVRPVTKHSDLAQNYYYDRDSRRNYPRLSVLTQKDVAGLIAAGNLKSITAGQGNSSDTTTDVAKIVENLSLTEVINALPKPLYSKDNLPPVPGVMNHNWKPSEDAVKPDPDQYWPMRMFS
ncbi:hypothetical protein G9A89_005893 [Geosiphon pyriformis]|nr:hypothetical protein G9A89_005893 [Geosiphon pyriformis]